MQTVDLADGAVKLSCGDCLELMKDIPDQSIDMILCDPPYACTAAEWDSIVPIDEMFAEYRRIISPCGAIAVFGTEPFSTKLREAAMDIFRYDWIWVKNKTVGFAHAKNKPMKKHEIISVFSLGTTGHLSQYMGGKT